MEGRKLKAAPRTAASPASGTEKRKSSRPPRAETVNAAPAANPGRFRRALGALGRAWRFIRPEARVWRADWRLFALAILSAVVMRFAYPRWNLAFVAAVGLVPFLWALTRARGGKQAFYLGFTYAAVYYYILVFWLNYLVEYRDAIPPAILIPIAIPGMAIWLGLFKGLFAWLVWWAGGRGRMPAVLAATAWVATDYLQSLGDLGFPWGYLGHALWRHPPLILLAAWTGVYGLTFILFWANHLILDAIRKGLREPTAPSAGRLALRAVLLAGFAAIAVAAALDGRARAERPGFYSTPSVEVAIVQPNIAQSEKFDSYNAREEEAAKFHGRILAKTIRLTSDHILQADEPPDLIVWPETAVTDEAFTINPWYRQFFRELATDRFDAGLLFGAANFVRYRDGRPFAPEEFDPDDYRAHPERYAWDAYVSAWYAEPDTGLRGQPYNKRKLVPFAEATPFLRIGSSFTRGTERPLFTVHDRQTRAPLVALGPLICFESVYPPLARDMVRQGADLLVVITNDAWYKLTAGPAQHQLQSVFRAVENRRWLARSANHGISCFISPLGEILQETELGRDATQQFAVRGTKGLTAYTRFGDFFALWTLATTLVLVVAATRWGT